MKVAARIALLMIAWLASAATASAQGDLKFAELGDFKLESGGAIRECRLGYRTFGELSKDRSNAVLVTTYFSGTSQDLINFIGPGKMLDSSKFFIIAVDAFGNGVSSSPSNSKPQPGASFPEFSIKDMVSAQHKFLTEHLKLAHLKAVAGISMGGMQAFQWMVSYPDFMDRAVSIIGTPKQTAYDLLLWQTQLKAIDMSKVSGASEAMKVVAGIQALAIQTPSYVASQVPAEKLKEHTAVQERRILMLDPFNYASQLRAMIGHDIYKAFGGSREQAAKAVRARLLVVVSEQDHMVNPSPALELAKLIKAETLVVNTECGHLAMFCEAKAITAGISAFLSK